MNKRPITRGDYTPGEAEGRQYIQKEKKKDIRSPYALTKPIVMTKVSSTNVAAIGYDRATQILQVEFLPSGKKGISVYRYFNVPPSVAEDFYQAHSKGTFVWKVLRGNYRYIKMTGVTKLYGHIKKIFGGY